MQQGISFKELYEVSLKATYPIEVGSKTFEVGETIAAFDRIQLANFQELKTQATANGGYDNRSLVLWEETKEVRLNFTQGVFSKQQLSLMVNARLVNKQDRTILVGKREEGETNENGVFVLKHLPQKPIFVYNKKTGEKINNWQLKEKELICNAPFVEILVDYQYTYDNEATHLQIGEALTQGYLSLTGKMKVKDDMTGQVTTGIINIPKLKLMSDLSMIPQVGRLDAVALPVGGKGNKKVMEIIFLEDDVDSDM